jgi:hypothetical protein
MPVVCEDEDGPVVFLCEAFRLADVLGPADLIEASIFNRRLPIQDAILHPLHDVAVKGPFILGRRLGRQGGESEDAGCQGRNSPPYNGGSDCHTITDPFR